MRQARALVAAIFSESPGGRRSDIQGNAFVDEDIGFVEERDAEFDIVEEGRRSFVSHDHQ